MLRIRDISDPEEFRSRLGDLGDSIDRQGDALLRNYCPETNDEAFPRPPLVDKEVGVDSQVADLGVETVRAENASRLKWELTRMASNGFSCPSGIGQERGPIEKEGWPADRRANRAGWRPAPRRTGC
jgi:hypothetical protein